MTQSNFRLALALALPAAALSGCYVLPVGSQDIAKIEMLVQQARALPAASSPSAVAPKAAALPPTAAAPAVAVPAAPAAPSTPIAIPARL